MKYSCFGLIIDSEFECPELPPAEGLAQIQIHTGSVPERLGNRIGERVLYDVAPDGFLFRLPGVARYLVRGGGRIVVQPADGAAPEAIRLFLLGVAFTALLHQRRILPLHGSVIETKGGVCVALLGNSGSGKSVLAAEFVRRGYRVLSDEVCAISEGDTPIVLPGVPGLMLWADAIKELDLGATAGLRRVRAEIEKFLVPLGSAFGAKSRVLHAVYALEVSFSGPTAVSQLEGFAKLPALVKNTRMEHLAQTMGLSRAYFHQLGKIAGQVPVRQITSARGDWQLEVLADLIEEGFAP